MYKRSPKFIGTHCVNLSEYIRPDQDMHSVN